MKEIIIYSLFFESNLKGRPASPKRLRHAGTPSFLSNERERHGTYV